MIFVLLYVLEERYPVLIQFILKKIILCQQIWPMGFNNIRFVFGERANRKCTNFVPVVAIIISAYHQQTMIKTTAKFNRRLQFGNLLKQGVAIFHSGFAEQLACAEGAIRIPPIAIRARHITFRE